MAFLELRLAGGQTHKLALKDGDNILGSGEQAGIRIQDPLVAPRQAVIHATPGACVIRNLAPDKPFYLNAAPVLTEQPLHPGDQLILGSTRCVFYDVDLEATREMLEISLCQKRSDATIGPTPEPASPPPPLVEPQPPVTDQDLQTCHHLSVTDAAGRQSLILLKEKEVILGSSSDAAVRLNGAGIAGRHAKIIQRERQVVVVDLESPAGVYLNDRRIARETLKEGDVIRLGAVRFTYHPPVAPPAQAEAAAQPAATPTPAKAPPIRSSRAPTWVAAGVIGLIITGVAVVGGIWFLQAPRLRRPGRGRPAPDAEMGAAAPAAAAGRPAVGRQGLPAAAGGKTGAARKRPDGNRSRSAGGDARQALAGGDLETALAYYFKIPPASVYRPEAGTAVLQHIDGAIDQTLSKPARV